MPQTAIVIGWKLALVLTAASSALTTLGIFIVARFTHVFDAYAGERAKFGKPFKAILKSI
jgi:hypothetical protein